MSIGTKTIAEWRKHRGEGMSSALGEYTPPEFWELLDAYEALLTKHVPEPEPHLFAKLCAIVDERPDVAIDFLEAMKSPGHDLTHGVVPVGADREPFIAMWNRLLDNISNEVDA